MRLYFTITTPLHPLYTHAHEKTHNTLLNDTVIPPFFAAVDNARSFVDPAGLLGVCDFYTAQKYEEKPKKMSWARRFFWRATFDIDGIDLGPERRMYLHHVLNTVYETSSQVCWCLWGGFDKHV